MGMREALAEVRLVDKGPWVAAFGADNHSWNIDQDSDEEADAGTGLPGRQLIADALRIFADCWGDFDLETAARAFNLPVDLIASIPVDRPYEADPADVRLDDLSSTIQVLSGCRAQFADISVATCAMLLNQHPTRIIEAVGAGYYMFLSGPRDDYSKLMIEHEGE